MQGRKNGLVRPDWYDDRDAFQAMLEKHGNIAALGRATGLRRSTLQGQMDKLGVSRSSDASSTGRGEKAGAEVKGDDATLVLPPGVELGDIEAMMKRHSLLPEQWVVRDVTLNKWDGFADGQVTEMRQVKAFLRRVPRLSLLSPAVEVRERKPSVVKPTEGPELWVFTSCWQAPYHDEGFHRAFCAWLSVNKPRHGVDLGDLLDLPTVSKHRDNPAYFAGVQECVNTGYRLLAERHDACRSTRWRLLEGNHDERLRSELLSRAERMYGIRPAVLPGDQPEEQVLSLRRLLHLDKLGVEFVQTPNGGNYEHAEIEVSEHLVARHGWLTGPNAGARTVEKLGRSVIVGHTHMQGIQEVPSYYRGVLENRIGVEVGCGCEVKPDGLGYAAQPRWVQGFATASVWKDGSFTVDLARYEDGVIRWRDQVVAA